MDHFSSTKKEHIGCKLVTHLSHGHCTDFHFPALIPDRNRLAGQAYRMQTGSLFPQKTEVTLDDVRRWNYRGHKRND
jgi:hypothetical protein